MQSARAKAEAEPSNWWTETENAVRESGDLSRLVEPLLGQDEAHRRHALELLATVLSELVQDARKLPKNRGRRQPRAIYDTRWPRRLQIDAAVRKLKSEGFVGEPPDFCLEKVAEQSSLIGKPLEAETLRAAYNGHNQTLRKARIEWADPSKKSQKVELTQEDRLALLRTLFEKLDRPKEDHLVPLWYLAKIRGLLVRIERGPKETKWEIAARGHDPDKSKMQMFFVDQKFWKKHARWKVHGSETEKALEAKMATNVREVFHAAEKKYNEHVAANEAAAREAGHWPPPPPPSKSDVFHDAVTRLIQLITIDRDDIPADGFRLLADFCARRKVPKA